MNFKKLLILLVLFSFGCDSDSEISYQDPDLIFIANEGKFGTSTGSITVINEYGILQTISELGDVVQSLQVYNNKLFVISNNSHKINVFEITEQGLLLPGIEIDTNGSSPREMTVIDNKLYFTNWNTKDIKILNLFNYKLEESIKVAGLPEAIINDGENIYVGIMMNEDYSDASTVLKVSPNSNQIINQYEVGKGPTSLLKHDEDIYVARTYYDSNWNSFYGTSKINSNNSEEVIKVNYGDGVVCGGSVNIFDDSPYRSHDGGIAKLNTDLSINSQTQIGLYSPSNVYSVQTHRDKVYIGTFDGYLKIIDSDNNEINNYKVGDFPGDIKFWNKN